VTSIASSGIAAVVIAFLAKSWIEARVKSSIEHEYRKQFELFSRDLDRKDKIELVAHLLAEYMKIPKGEQMPRDQRLLLNKLSFTSTIWFPAALAIEVSKTVQNAANAKSVFELMLMARKELLGDESLTVEHVTVWSTTLETRGDPVLVPR
jgi:hypothetical protein